MNPFRQLLKAAGGHPPLGTWIMSASPIVAEAVGCAGFDWGVIDMEHTPLDMMGVLHMLQALSSTRMVPLLRVPSNDTVTVKRVLDAGAATLLFPCVQNADEAALAVASTRYPPEGHRAIAGMSRASRYATVPNYTATANRSIGVIVQLETIDAVDRLAEIAGVEGVDALFIGPADLSASMGHVGQPTHPAVVDRMAQAVRHAKECGKPIGTLGASPENVAQYRAVGFDYVAIASDLGLLMRGAQAALAALRTQEVAHIHTLSGGTRPADVGY
jgi:2-dehydro-3-deoxyglucarate aldolase